MGGGGRKTADAPHVRAKEEEDEEEVGNIEAEQKRSRKHAPRHSAGLRSGFSNERLFSQLAERVQRGGKYICTYKKKKEQRYKNGREIIACLVCLCPVGSEPKGEEDKLHQGGGGGVLSTAFAILDSETRRQS